MTGLAEAIANTAAQQHDSVKLGTSIVTSLLTVWVY